MTDDVRNLIRFVVDGDIRNAQTQCRIMLEKNVPEKDARFKENELRKLNLLKPELIQLPANLENLLIAEDATNFPESRFLLREEEEIVINKLLATRKAALAIKELGIHYTCSLLLTGLPGVGKTELARYIAHKANLPFVFLKFSGLVNSALGRTQQNIGRVFDYAKRTPCVLCVDEIDAIGMCRGSRDDVAEMSRVTIALMQDEALDISGNDEQHFQAYHDARWNGTGVIEARDLLIPQLKRMGIGWNGNFGISNAGLAYNSKLAYEPLPHVEGSFQIKAL